MQSVTDQSFQLQNSLVLTMKSLFTPLSSIWFDNVGLDRILYFLHGCVWQLRKLFGITFVAKLPNGARVKIYPHTSFSGVFYSRWLERKDTLFIRKHASLAPIYVDVGANTGLMAAQFFDKFSKFYLFEPAPSSYSALVETCRLNPHVACETFNIAIADTTGRVLFLDEGNFSATSRIISGLPGSAGTVREVTVDTLDNVLGQLNEDIILKIDVEGAEERVFAGARSLFESQRVKLVMFERLARTNLDNLKNFFRAHDYALFYVDEQGTTIKDELHINKPLINLFACPRIVAKVISNDFS